MELGSTNENYVKDEDKNSETEIDGSVVVDADLSKASYNVVAGEEELEKELNGDVPDSNEQPDKSLTNGSPPSDKPITNDSKEINENGHVDIEGGKGFKKTVVKRKVGTSQAISVVIGTMIGAGIFASTAPVFDRTNSVGLSLIVWAASGVVVMFCSLSYLELATMFPKSGGEFLYLREVYGPLPAFLYAYTTSLILKPATLSAVVLVSADYIIQPFTKLESFPADDRTWISKLLAATIFGLIVFVNCISVRLALRVQVFFTAAKLAALAMLIITGLVHIGKGNVEHFKDAFNGSSTEIADIGFAFYGGLWAYDGWNNLNFLTDELKDPFKTLPLAIMIGIPIVTGFYVMANVAYSAILTSVEIANSKAVAVLIANRMYGVMAWIMPILVACSTFGSANGTAFGCGRLIYVSAREGHMPEILSMVHTKRHTPIPALTFTCIIGWIMLAPDSSNFVTIINYFNFAAWIFYGMTISTVLWMRWKKPDLKRPYKVFIGIPILCLLVSIYLVIAPFWRSPWQSFGCLCFILMGIPIYFAFVKYKVCPKPILRGFHAFTKMLMHKLNLSVPEADDVDAS